ncbi:MAG: hypothetical protein R6T92_10250 [Desulfosalsimonadaceae bacterium]
MTVEAEDYAAMDGLRVLEREEASGGRTVKKLEQAASEQVKILDEKAFEELLKQRES